MAPARFLGIQSKGITARKCPRSMSPKRDAKGRLSNGLDGNLEALRTPHPSQLLLVLEIAMSRIEHSGTCKNAERVTLPACAKRQCVFGRDQLRALSHEPRRPRQRLRWEI